MPILARSTACLCVALSAGVASAQWNPSQGDWGKTDPADYRVMTWNVGDAVCSSNTKTDAFRDWNAIVRIIAALEPDVLIMQEVGDNSGNGTGSGVDSVSTLENTLELMIHGGNDPYVGGTVGSYIQKFKPAYDLPYIYVSPSDDGFNRNVILSRYPFADINNNGTSTLANFVALVDPAAWDMGTSGGIRGFAHAEIDLPDEIYAGDVIVGNSHLKSGGSSSDYNQRIDAARAIAYYIQYYWNTNQTGNDDPNNRVFSPIDGDTVDANTPFIWGGDWNDQPGDGIAEFMVRAENFGGSDGTDRDGSDSTRDNASQPISGDSSTQSSSKLDYIVWQDSIATSRREFVFRSTGTGMNISKLPSPVDTYPVQPLSASSLASDHRPVIVDFMLPLAPQCPCDYTGDGSLTADDIDLFVTAFTDGIADNADQDGDGDEDADDINAFVTCFTAPPAGC